jgi:hypothetical protein
MLIHRPTFSGDIIVGMALCLNVRFGQNLPEEFGGPTNASSFSILILDFGVNGTRMGATSRVYQWPFKPTACPGARIPAGIL